eukprot:Tamp_12884.p1 GENE.Tamp_12884~~Tamp_12884.p1  ORF type:complete len:204 (+),score=12.31 Tamp_12884:1127-1738(+)
MHAHSMDTSTHALARVRILMSTDAVTAVRECVLVHVCACAQGARQGKRAPLLKQDTVQTILEHLDETKEKWEHQAASAPSGKPPTLWKRGSTNHWIVEPPPNRRLSYTKPDRDSPSTDLGHQHHHEHHHRFHGADHVSTETSPKDRAWQRERDRNRERQREGEEHGRVGRARSNERHQRRAHDHHDHDDHDDHHQWHRTRSSH